MANKSNRGGSSGGKDPKSPGSSTKVPRENNTGRFIDAPIRKTPNAVTDTVPPAPKPKK